MRELLLRIDSRELSEWAAYFELNPFGPERDDLRSGVVAATVANSLGSGGFKPSDFMPTYGPPVEERPKTWQQLRDAGMQLCAMLGGTIQ